MERRDDAKDGKDERKEAKEGNGDNGYLTAATGQRREQEQGCVCEGVHRVMQIPRE